MTYSNPGYLIHYGVKGQKKGVRRYQNEDGSYTSEGREHYGFGNGQKRGMNLEQKVAVGVIGSRLIGAAHKKHRQINTHKEFGKDQKAVNEPKRTRLKDEHEEELARYGMNSRKRIINDMKKNRNMSFNKASGREDSRIFKKQLTSIAVTTALGYAGFAIMKKRVNSVMRKQYRTPVDGIELNRGDYTIK